MKAPVLVHGVDLAFADGEQRRDALEHLGVLGDELLKIALDVAGADERVHDVELDLYLVDVLVDLSEVDVVLVVADAVPELA